MQQILDDVVITLPALELLPLVLKTGGGFRDCF